MFKIALVCAFLAVATSTSPTAPPPPQKPAPGSAPPAPGAQLAKISREPKNYAQIVNQESSVDVDGKYHYSFETSDGTKAAQTGELKHVGNDVGESSKGFYEYQDKGEVFRVDYTADEHGFVATGPHIPKIPEAISRALKWAAEHPYKEPERKKH